MDTQLFAILRIGHDTSMRGCGLSLREALARAQYVALRGSFGAIDLLPLIKSLPTLTEEWISYSQDKRTSAGWYLTEQCEIGSLGATSERLRFDSIEEAVAEYVMRELDYWAGLTEAG
ncbi:MAG TPA: hypothetical protein VJH03_05475 [Blastocatellia bacterium]|nr:hypothetical protein [Blastocatellia bacterium]